jgi:hypothetical protein
MAQTYRAVVTGATFASNKSMLTVFNGSGSGRIVRVKRIWFLNNQTTGVTGALTTMEIRRISASTGGSAAASVKHDSNSENIPAQITITTGPTDTLTGDPALMRFMWSNDEPAVSSLVNDEVEVIPALACVFDAATGDADLEPLTLREGQGVSVRHTGSSAVGVADAIIEFTMAAS